jgi:hypothetical protein
MMMTKRSIRIGLLQFLCWGAVVGLPYGFAAEADVAASAPRPKSQNVTINLINRLVERGVLPAEDARELIQQAENDAAEARAQAQKTLTDQATNDTVSVRYVPEVVKMQIRDEIKADLVQQARAERWIAPNALPAWVSRFRVTGDVRVREEGLFLPGGSDTTGASYPQFTDYNKINTGSPFDTANVTTFTLPPQRDVDQDRNRLRLRVRLGAEIDLENGFTAGLRLATGDSNSPVSPNQSLGGSGQFSKYAIWLDRGFIKYEWGGLPTDNWAISIGRFDSPFFSTSEIVWDGDLGFDGLAVQGRKAVVEGVTAFGAAGVFPIFNTDLNFSSNRPDKYPSTDKWLYGGQLGIDWKINEDFNLKAAGAFLIFDGVEGKLSDPVFLTSSADQGNTDGTRPSFAQFGNTYMALRNIIPVPGAPPFGNNNGTANQWQYFGLATPFRDIVFTGRLDYKHFEPFNVSLFGEFIKNVAFDSGNINAVAENNRLPVFSGPYVGGDTAWIVGLKLGHVALQKRWDWNIGLDYRYVESDAVVDGFCDSDFGGGGTNVKGYSISAAIALAPRISLGLRWMSSDQVAGPTFKADTFQFDVSAKF